MRSLLRENWCSRYIWIPLRDSSFVFGQNDYNFLTSALEMISYCKIVFSLQENELCSFSGSGKIGEGWRFWWKWLRKFWGIGRYLSFFSMFVIILSSVSTCTPFGDSSERKRVDGGIFLSGVLQYYIYCL